MRFLTSAPLGRLTRAPFLLLVALTACGTLGMHVIIPALPATNPGVFENREQTRTGRGCGAVEASWARSRRFARVRG